MITISSIRETKVYDFDREFEYKLQKGFKLVPNSIISVPPTNVSCGYTQATFWKSDLNEDFM